MRKILFICLMFTSFLTKAMMLPPTTICKDSGWAEILVQYKPQYKSEEKPSLRPRWPHYRSGFEICVLPDGKVYSPRDLLENKDTQYKDLFDLYSGQYPTFEQIEKAKEQYRKNGYIVD